MLLHPNMLKAMAQAIAEERTREAQLMRAAYADHARLEGPVRAWLALTLLHAALRLDRGVMRRRAEMEVAGPAG